MTSFLLSILEFLSDDCLDDVLDNDSDSDDDALIDFGFCLTMD